MAEVIPFKGVLYNPQKVDATSAMAPPYDIVTPELKDVLYNRSPYNIIRIDFGKDNENDNELENRYTRAAESFNNWIAKGVLVQDLEPLFYCYEATYNPPLPPFIKGGHGGIEKKLRGFLGVVKLEELGNGKIHPHEMTYSKPKTDRLNILRFCNANISPIFALYSSTGKLASRIIENTVKEKTLIEAQNGDGFIHRLWRITDKTSIETIKKEMADKDILIADGHHRYETALDFKNEMAAKGMVKTGKEPFNYVMMLLVNTEDNGLTILPTHRLANIRNNKNIKKSLSPYFDIQAIEFDSSTVVKAKEEMFRTMKNGRNLLGMFIKGQNMFNVLRFKGSYSDVNFHESLRKIDVIILHKFIFEKLLSVEEFEYEMDADIVIQKVNSGSFHTAFFLNPTKVHDVKEVALAGQRMPPKSTYFYPKLLTGMVIYKF